MTSIMLYFAIYSRIFLCAISLFEAVKERKERKKRNTMLNKSYFSFWGTITQTRVFEAIKSYSVQAVQAFIPPFSLF